MRCPIHGSKLVNGECAKCREKAAFRIEQATKAGVKRLK